MILKIVTLFLIGIAVLAMFGRLRLRLPKSLARTKCRACGTPRIGRGACPCGKG
ncbi:hypothetical protein [Jannaschia sp. LMIT008]|uniref:hypothetical protein n=1 Tax=Jannaschia maritima TaxID=3032585 RepID=UPI00281115AE|nr:hypothetical protein [Jannaschia sp. LMIT008]